MELRYFSFMKRFGLDLLPKLPEEYVALYQAMDKYKVAAQSYVMKPYSGVIDLFRSKIRLYYLEDSMYLGWKPYTDQAIRVHDIPGDHDNMLSSANCKQFAQILQKAIDDCDVILK